MLPRPRPLRRLPLAALILALCLGSAVPAASQEPAASILVRVHAADTGRPLGGAVVSVAGVGFQGTTDPAGRLVVRGLTPGTHSVEARYLGYAATAGQVVFTGGDPAELRLDLPLQPIPLAELRVTTFRPLLETTGFRDRRRAGFGTFVTREQITRMRPRLLSDVLRRVAGMSLSGARVGGDARASVRGNKVMMGSCPIQYYIDGTMTAAFNVDDVPPADVEGLEIYRGAATIPPVFNKGTALCGVVVIWTRDR